MPKPARRKILIVPVIIIMIAAVFVLTACNKTENESSDGVYQLYLTGYFFDTANKTMTAYVSTPGSGGIKLNGATANFSGRVDKNGFWYGSVISDYIFAPSAIYRAVDEAIPQDDRIYKGVEYSIMKVAFRYDTIYKSAVSNGARVKYGNLYRHTLEIDKTAQTASFTSTRKTPNSANWYTVLLSCGIITVVAAVTVTVVIERKKCLKK